MPHLFRGPSARRNKMIAGGGLIIAITIACFVAVVVTVQYRNAENKKIEVTRTAQKTKKSQTSRTPLVKDHDYTKDNLEKAKNMTNDGMNFNSAQNKTHSAEHGSIETNIGNSTTASGSSTPVPGKSVAQNATNN